MWLPSNLRGLKPQCEFLVYGTRVLLLLVVAVNRVAISLTWVSGSSTKRLNHGKANSLGSGVSMAAKLKLKEIGARGLI